MTSIDRRFLDLAGLSEPDPPQPSGLYSSAIAHDGLVWVSGHSGKADGKVVFTGRLGADCTHEDGVEAARLACITALSSASALLNGLSRIARPLKLTGYVKSAQDFHDQAQIVDGASRFLLDLFGRDQGSHARSAVGIAELPGGTSVAVALVLAATR
ncbi:MAG: RidA family protein [Hyphomicrobiaceae bacterium]|nr:RidA family protein [Hyphomicrobiaceae bacterium]